MHISSLLYAVCMITTCAGSVATNILLLILIASHRKLRTETWVLTLNLTISDLILAITIIPSSVYSSFGGSALTTNMMVCRLAAFLFVLLQLSSLHSLTWMTIDKCTEIGFPLHYAQLFTGRRTWLIISGLWIYCTLTAALPFMGFGYYVYNENANICAPKFSSSTKAYSMVLLILGMIIPLIVICVLYISIVHIAKHQARRGTFVCNEHHCYYVPIRPYFRNTFLLVSSALYLVVCWIPYTTISFMDIFQEEKVPSLVEKMSTWLILLTSVLNPWLTSLGQKKYRKAMQETWKKFKQASAHLEANAPPSTRETGLSLRSRFSLPGSTSQTSAHK
ncbi:adenosine receptor A3-like [Lissotriton helveticus]